MLKIKQIASGIFAGLSLLSAPILSNEYSNKGYYLTGSIGGSAIGDIDVSGVNYDIELETGLGLDLG